MNQFVDRAMSSIDSMYHALSEIRKGKENISILAKSWNIMLTPAEVDEIWKRFQDNSTKTVTDVVKLC